VLRSRPRHKTHDRPRPRTRLARYAAGNEASGRWRGAEGLVTIAMTLDVSLHQSWPEYAFSASQKTMPGHELHCGERSEGPS
jgi:hypothetical protein